MKKSRRTWNLAISSAAMALKNFRENKNMSAETLAWKTGLSSQTIYNIEHQQAGTTLHTVYLLCQGLEIDPMDFFAMFVASQCLGDNIKKLQATCVNRYFDPESGCRIN